LLQRNMWGTLSHTGEKGVPRLLAKRASHRGIEITSNATGQTSGIKRKAVNQGLHTLEFHLTGDGTLSAHKIIMKTKAKEYSQTIISSSLQRGESSMVYNSYYMVSLSYDTYVTSLDVKECEEIQRPVVNVILPKMGVNRNTARNVVFGTSKYGGLGIDHLAAVQGFAQLQYLIGSLRTQDTTGDLYQMLLEYTQLECGTVTSILEAEFTMYEPTILTKNYHGMLEVFVTLKIHRGDIRPVGTGYGKKGRHIIDGRVQNTRHDGRTNERYQHMQNLPTGISPTGHCGPSRKYYRGTGKTREMAKQQDEQVELAGPTKATCRGMKKLGSRPLGHCIIRR
jgi:hypothetical protein